MRGEREHLVGGGGRCGMDASTAPEPANHGWSLDSGGLFTDISPSEPQFNLFLNHFTFLSEPVVFVYRYLISIIL